MHSPPWKLSLCPCKSILVCLGPGEVQVQDVCDLLEMVQHSYSPHPSLSGQETEKELDLPQATQLVQSSLL